MSASWAYGPPSREATLITRGTTWGLTPLRARLRLLGQMLALAVRGPGYGTVVVVTCGWEVLVLCALKLRYRLVVADWLIPSSGLLARSWLWRRVDEFVVVRSGDRSYLQTRFGITADRCRFVHFPAPAVPSLSADSDRTVGEPYAYSAGWAHRDWETLSEALLRARIPAVVSCATTVQFPEWVTVLAQLSPEEGRKNLEAAAFLVLSLEETPLPSGPLVLLDGMARGKAVIASRVNGSIDYVDDGANGLLVPPGDPQALALAMRTLYDDPQLARSLGNEARKVGEEFTGDRFWTAVLANSESKG